MVSFGLLLAFWIVAATVVNVRERGRGVRGGVVAQLARQPRSYWGMIVAHLGIAVFIVGVTMVKGYETERDVRMDVGDTVTVGGYTFRFDGTTDTRGPELPRGARRVRREPQRPARDARMYPGEARLRRQRHADDRGGDRQRCSTGDLYVSLGEPVDGGAWSVRVYHKPFVTWIWGGCLLMALGGLLALSDRRYRARAAARGRASRGGAAARALGARR